MQKFPKVMSKVRLAALFAVSIGASTFASKAGAQDVCFPTPVSLPGLSGPPDWKAPGTVRTELNEPRWAAAPTTAFADDLTGGAEGAFRILVDAARSQISVSVQAATDMNSASNADAVYFAFTTDGVAATLAQGVRINLPASGSDPIDLSGVQQFVYDCRGSLSLSPEPSGTDRDYAGHNGT